MFVDRDQNTILKSLVISVLFVFGGCIQLDGRVNARFPFAPFPTKQSVNSQSLGEPDPSSTFRPNSNFPIVFPTVQVTAFDNSVLNQSQRDRLNWVAKQYIAESEEKGIEIAQGLNFAGKFSHPSNMCGPLAIAILRDTGLVNQYIDLHEFWNMDPRPGEDEKLLELTFPRNRYLWIRVNTPIDQFDFTDFPLYTGDFLYLYSGYEGSFEHILVVTRVDETGRVFSITNFRNENQEYLINELMLYDPNKPGEGMFNHWTNQDNFTTGITGFGGFQLWRPLYPIKEPDSQQLNLAYSLDSIFNESGGDWNVVIKEVGGDIIYDRRGSERIHTASVIKVPLAVLFFYALEQNHQEVNDEWLDLHGTGGRSYNQLLEAMIVNSEEEATDILEDWVNRWISPKNVLTNWGFPQMSISPRRASTIEMTELFEGLFQGKWINSFGRETILNFLSQYSPNDETRLGVLNNYLPNGSVIYNKRGSIANGQMIVADVALIEVGGRAYVLAFFATPGSDSNLAFETLDAAIEKAAIAFWNIYRK